ncbi:MAG: hypothetical protein ACFFFK_00105 [Candidatus Thorarchaeota archaeon]
MNNAERHLQVRNATILMVLAGATQIYFAYGLFQISLVYPSFATTIAVTLMIATGLLSLFVSLAVWKQQSWAASAVACIGIFVCGGLLFLGFYLVIFLFGPWYWAVIDYIRAGRVAQPFNRNDDQT